MTSSTPDAPLGRFIELTRTMALLALPASAQEYFLNAHDLAPSLDELALPFQDELPLVTTLAHVWMTQRQAEVVAIVNGHLSAVSARNKPTLWRVPAPQTQA